VGRVRGGPCQLHDADSRPGSGRLHPEIGRLADWSDTATTLTDLYQRRIRGNAVLTIS